jgi:hypothetical protein
MKLKNSNRKQPVDSRPRAGFAKKALLLTGLTVGVALAGNAQVPGSAYSYKSKSDTLFTWAFNNLYRNVMHKGESQVPNLKHMYDVSITLSRKAKEALELRGDVILSAKNQKKLAKSEGGIVEFDDYVVTYAIPEGSKTPVLRVFRKEFK